MKVGCRDTPHPDTIVNIEEMDRQARARPRLIREPHEVTAMG